MTRADGKRQIEQLVDNFEKNQTYYLSAKFNETATRNAFINPFFQALGWEMTQTHLPLPEWDVLPEFHLKGTGTRPDYAFRIERKIKFFVEAKAPHIPLTDKAPIFQAKQYAFSCSYDASVVILTDFEEFRVFNALERPIFENPLHGLLKKFDLKYTKYSKKWDVLYDHFSKEAVREGSIESLRKTLAKNTKPLDDEFLIDITTWREELARHLAVRNTDLTVDELNEAVQRILDRLVFIRNLEDRHIEPDNTLLTIAKNPEDGLTVYQSLVPLFNRMNIEYNGLLFKPHFSEQLTIDDRYLKKIIYEMCYPKSPFRFDVIPPEILGRIYERFLGSKIRLTDAHRAKVEEKPEVRKAGGVYYTPQYIVDYIVKNTVGNKIKGLEPEEIKNIKILDPACGSGSFLLGALDYLIEYHRDWYTKNKDKYKKKYRDDFFETQTGDIQLTLTKKGDILRNNIFGVDIDREATEVAIMSLYLKLLEEGYDKQLELFGGRAVLPIMTNNIKCGNSLIGSDFYDGQLDLDLEEQKRINAFDWEIEFDEIFKNGGFDCVIGNPPYGALFEKHEKLYLKSKFEAMVGKFDSYGFFIESSLNLLKLEGVLGFITPHTWLTVLEAKKMREYILENSIITEIERLPTKVFDQATVNTILFFLEKENDDVILKNHIVNVYLFDPISTIDEIRLEKASHNEYPQNYWKTSESFMFNINVSIFEQDILIKLKSNKKLSRVCDFCVGIQAYDSYAGQNKKIIESRAYHANYRKDETYIRELNGKDVSRYFYSWSGKSWVSYGQWLAHPRQPHFFNGQRILVREITGQGKHSIHATFLEENFINYKTILNIKLNKNGEELGYHILFFLGVLNSSLISWYFPRVSNKLVTKTFPRISILDMKRFPEPNINFDNPSDKAAHDQMVALVDKMLKLHQDLSVAKSERDKSLLQRQITHTDHRIDQLVYELYDLTEEEIAIVEGE